MADESPVLPPIALDDLAAGPPRALTGHGDGLRLLVYDDTCTHDLIGPVGLTHTWRAGAKLYAGLGRLDAAKPARNWVEALEWLARVRPGESIAEIQFWGHGNWGLARIGRDRLDRSALEPGSLLHHSLREVRERLTARSLWWFRTCETFGASAGHDFAQALPDFLGCDAAGHTHIIGPWQSGLHRLAPGRRPHWSATEGLR
ncbi:MAG: hypothetical protein AAF602_32450, partial [Myxococcota bacterium]